MGLLSRIDAKIRRSILPVMRGAPRVMMLGTCRVIDPFEILQARGDVRVLPRFWGYPHSSSEVRQVLRLASGELVPPPDADAGMLNLPHLPRTGSGQDAALRRMVDRADIAFVEISSLKTYAVGDYLTQSNIISETTGIHAFDIDHWLRSGTRNNLSDAEVALLDGYEAVTETLDTLADTLRDILDRLSPMPVVVMNHFVAAEPCHSALHVRRDIREVVRGVANGRAGVTYFDPTPLLEARDYPIMDFAHYEDGFKDVLADAYFAMITDALA